MMGVILNNNINTWTKIIVYTLCLKHKRMSLDLEKTPHHLIAKVVKCMQKLSHIQLKQRSQNGHKCINYNVYGKKTQEDNVGQYAILRPQFSVGSINSRCAGKCPSSCLIVYKMLHLAQTSVLKQELHRLPHSRCGITLQLKRMIKNMYCGSSDRNRVINKRCTHTLMVLDLDVAL